MYTVVWIVAKFGWEGMAEGENGGAEMRTVGGNGCVCVRGRERRGREGGREIEKGKMG